MTANRTNTFPARCFAILALCALLAAAGAAPAMASGGGTSDFYLGGSGGDYSVPVGKTLLDTRFKNVIHQHYDFSCGSAALATLLTYHYHHPIAEKDVLDAMYLTGDQTKIRKEGFSLLDMKNYLESIGYKADGYRDSLDKLANVGIPAIALINKHGYMHFVVVQGVSKDKVAVGDPTLGLTVYNRKDFEKMWNGILFVVLNNKNIAQAAFNTADNWNYNGSPNFRNMLDRGELGELTIDISLTPNYY